MSHSARMVWFRVAKVGTRSVFEALRQAGVRMDIENGIFLHYPPNAWREYFKFAFVRNPWERFLSCFHDRVMDRNHFGFDPAELERMRNLDAFIDFAAGQDPARCDVHLREQSRLIDLNNINFLGRMETFEEDLAKIFQRLGVPTREVPRRNVSSRSGEARLSPAQAARVADIYERDIRIFGYRWEG